MAMWELARPDSRNCLTKATPELRAVKQDSHHVGTGGLQFGQLGIKIVVSQRHHFISDFFPTGLFH